MLEVNRHLGREVAARFRDIDEPVETGMVKVLAVEKVIDVQRHLHGAAVPMEMVSGREVEHPIAVGGFLGRNDVVLPTYQSGIDCHEGRKFGRRHLSAQTESVLPFHLG